mmetsp:Transcript_4518/g.13000  ORF Transcript_4518/g.13000 Transcript_4518/m.13000 type:complete len:264 (-) Transcript_4518:426-1217(-)|eukprot:CAMPEP_0172356892 /NCGR_PEP_ID=MMETSP1060-20121228/1279_1 /TAXON_ID=37318 /ORGANISM="Pseudo-nitzschia pungens, Strain cf. cingulata" /LENGTH=263 /DNA_ID=CAMNT_0013077285 /DNA_START=203 /DNA_END=994 /DNA_ORIENTATION=-
MLRRCRLAFSFALAFALASTAVAFQCFGSRCVGRTRSLAPLRATTNVNSNNNNKNGENFFSPEQLVAMARDYVKNPSPDWWDDEDFVFRGPVIGPLVKKDLVFTLEANADLSRAFPDLQANAFGFTADDPIEPNRVWYFVRPRGTFAGSFPFPGFAGEVIEPTNAPYIGAPECRSVVFNREGKIVYQTVGYVVDRFTGDTTGGRGAIFGQYAVMGKEIDAHPGAWSTVLLQKLGEYLPDFPKSYSKREDLPEWWKDERMGAEL